MRANVFTIFEYIVWRSIEALRAGYLRLRPKAQDFVDWFNKGFATTLTGQCNLLNYLSSQLC